MSGSVSAKSLIDELKRKRTISPLAGKLAPKKMLMDVVGLEREYLERWPDVADPNQVVSFGTSGHRGSPDLRGDL
jgi:phosphoglucomutase